MNKNDPNKILIDNLSILSREIKNPVNMMSATIKYIKMMLDKGLSIDDIKELMEKMLNNCDKIELAVDNIMSIDNIIPTDYNLLSIRDFTEKFASAIQYLEKEYDFEFKYKINSNDELIKIPVSSTERILLNLISNAIKFNSKKKKTVSLTITQNEDDVIFTIKDNGDGIPEENLTKVTDKLFRDSSTKTAGLGLGLYLVKETINAAGGTLSINSTLKKGTEVTFSIPTKNGKITLRGSDYEYKPSLSYFKREFSTLNK